MKRVSSDLVAFTDDDCIVHSNWIKNILNSNYWELSEDIVGIGGNVLSYRKDIISQYWEEKINYNKSVTPFFLITANCCYKKEILMRHGGFDEDLKMTVEDIALSIKLSKAGYKFKIDKEIIVWHDYKPSIIDFIKKQHHYATKKELKYYTKYLDIKRIKISKTILPNLNLFFKTSLGFILSKMPIKKKVGFCTLWLFEFSVIRFGLFKSFLKYKLLKL